MLILPFLFLLMNSRPIRQAPPGTLIQIRLTTTVGSYASTAGTRVSAVLIAPVMVDGETVLPAGSVGSGIVRRAARVGLNSSALARKVLPLLPPAISTCPFGSGAATAA